MSDHATTSATDRIELALSLSLDEVVDAARAAVGEFRESLRGLGTERIKPALWNVMVTLSATLIVYDANAARLAEAKGKP